MNKCEKCGESRQHLYATPMGFIHAECKDPYYYYRRVKDLDPGLYRRAVETASLVNLYYKEKDPIQLAAKVEEAIMELVWQTILLYGD